MRWALLLLPLILIGFVHIPYGVDDGVDDGPIVVVGPLLTPPNPDVYSTVPFVLRPTGQKVSVEPAAAEEKLIVVLIDFPDEVGVRSPQILDNMLFDQTAGVGSLYGFYLENSYGDTQVTGLISNQWYRSDRNRAYYGADGDGIDDANGPIYCLTVDAVLRADALIDFSQYDLDGDGTVDHVVIIHAGGGQENSASKPDIWSHRWAVIDARQCGFPSRQLTADGVRIYGYFMTSEESPVGVFSHELGHDFGLPDLYDTTGDTDGIGVWGIMGTGSWNGAPRGTQPAHFNAWSKAKMGWLNLTEATAPLLPATLPQVETTATAYRLLIKSSPLGDEYFIVENRQRVGFDSSLPGSGLLIWHIDETRKNNDDADRRIVDLEEADEGLGIFYADKLDQGTDPWRDDSVGFTPRTTPNSNDNNGARTGWKVTAIGPSGPMMAANISKGVAVDVSILDISKRDFVTVNQSVDVSVRVINKGLVEIANGSLIFDVYHEAYEVGSRVLTQQEPIPLLPEGGVVLLSFTFTPFLEGRYLIEAFADIYGDEVPEDNYRIVHLLAGEYLLMEDVEGSVSDWNTPTNFQSPYRWEVVEDGGGFGEAHSPTHSWRFGYFGIAGPSLTYEYHYLETPTIQLQGETPRVVFYQRFELTARTEGITMQPLDSDVATVEVSFDGGAWTSLTTFTGIQLTWERMYIDLAPYSLGASDMVLRFNATARIMPDDGGWWVDDLVVLTQPLESAALVKPLETQKEVIAGGSTSFIFLLVNIGDLDEEFHFTVEGLPFDWKAFIGSNETTAVPVTDYNVNLGVDDQLFLTLIVRASILAERGVPVQGLLQALSSDEEAGASFIFTVSVPLGFGLNLSGRALVVAFILGGVMLAIAVVLTAVRKRERH